MSGEGGSASCFLDGHLAVSAPVGRGEGALLRPFRKGARLIHEGSALMPYSPPRGPTS